MCLSGAKALKLSPLAPLLTALAFARHPHTRLRDAFARHGRGRGRVGASPPPRLRASAPPSGLPVLPPLPRAPQFRAPLHRPGPAARPRAEGAAHGGEGGQPRRRGREIAHIRRTDAGADLALPPSARWLLFIYFGTCVCF